MGNLSGCFKMSSSSKNMAKLVDSVGQLRLIELPITTVAELMMENPGFAVTPVNELRRSHRISAMKADEMLLGRKVYLLVPVDKVNSRLLDSQLAAIDSLICSRTKRIRTRGGSKVSPVVELEDLVKDLGRKNTGLTGQRKRVCKGWVPVLEPISELC